MKKNNAILAGVAAVALAAAMVPAAMAATEGGTGKTDPVQTEVKYEVVEGYSWTVPTTVNFKQNAGAGQKTVDGEVLGNGGKVTVKDNVIAHGKALKITAEGSGENGTFTVSNGNEILGYTVTGNGKIDPKGEVLRVVAGTPTGEQALSFVLTTTTDKAETAGKYTGTITYTASVVDNNA